MSVAARDAGEGQMLAISRRSEALHDRSDFVQVGEVEGHVGADRKPDPMCGQGNPTDQIENRRLNRSAAANAVVYGDFEDVEVLEVITRPTTDGRAIPDADCGDWLAARHLRDPHTVPAPSAARLRPPKLW